MFYQLPVQKEVENIKALEYMVDILFHNNWCLHSSFRSKYIIYYKFHISTVYFQIDNCRRTHNYDQFLCTFLSMLAEQGHLADLVQQHSFIKKRVPGHVRKITKLSQVAKKKKPKPKKRKWELQMLLLNQRLVYMLSLCRIKQKRNSL